MSKEIKIGFIIIGLLFSNIAFAESYDEYYIAPPSEIIDLNAQKTYVQAVVKSKSASAPNKGQIVHKPKKSKGLLADVATTFNVDVCTQADENGPVDQTQISANFKANKGPFYFQYSHSRYYTRVSDPFYIDASSEFQGSVNNRFTVGVSIKPDIANKTAQTMVIN